MLRYGSGNPWLVGNLGQDELTVVTEGSLRVAVIGSCPVTATRLAELVARVRTAADLDTVLPELPGCAHVVASVHGVTRIQGSVSGLRAVFHTRIHGLPVAGDRADVLARAAGSGVDEHVLAVRVACGSKVPPPLGEQSLWRAVRALAPDCYLRIDTDNRASEVRWWHPPEPTVALRIGADAVREELTAAVALRSAVPGRRLSADLSGGMDSTTLCFLAARAAAGDLLTFRWAEADVANDDAVFAAHAASELPLAEHLVLDQAQMPGVFADPGAVGDTEAPYRFARTLARSRHNAQLLVAHGSRQHLAGHGGDELFHPPLAYLHPLLRRRPRTAIAQLRGYRALGRWSWAATVSSLADRSDLSGWWHQQAGQLGTGQLPRRWPPFGWGHPLRASTWATPTAVETARAQLGRTADAALPLAADRGQHATLAIMRTMGTAYRQLSRVFAGAGLRLELPYLDDRVVGAVLAVRQHERSTPWRYKPLLAEAMRGILPEKIAARCTKGEFGADARIGLRRHRSEILGLFADSALASLGLINTDRLRRELLAPQIDNTALIALEDLLGAEMWLRSASALPTLRRNDADTAAR